MSKNEQTSKTDFSESAGASSESKTILITTTNGISMLRTYAGERGAMGPNPNGPPGDWTYHFPEKN